MKKIAMFFFLFILTGSLFGQEIEGQWNGILKFQGSQLRIVLTINKTDTGFVSSMDSPDQGAKDIPVNITTFEDSVLKVEVTSLGAKYEGVLTDESQIVGELKQMGITIPLTLTRVISDKATVIRPQNPVEPYPYHSEEVKFINPKDQTVLAGTLTLPKKSGKFPVVVLISGSGAQNRNEELMDHKPFLILADQLTRSDIAVLRYDDRGTAQSTGDFSKATTSILATDVEAAIRYLLTRNEIDKKKIGLIGHSEGSSIASIVAAKCKDVRFIVLMAGPGLRGEELLLLQEEKIGKVSGVTEASLSRRLALNKGAFDIIVNTTNPDVMGKELRDYLLKKVSDMPIEEKPEGISDELIVQNVIDQFTTPWFLEFLKYDPSLILRKVKCPVLALNGSKDLQVSAKENLTAIKTNLDKGGNDEVTIREYPNLNHLFQDCTTGSPAEYGVIQQTISSQVLNEISRWILRKTN